MAAPSIPTSARALAAVSNGAPGTNRGSPDPLAPFVDGFVDPVAKPVRVLVGERPFQVAHDDADQEVLLARRHAEASPRGGRKRRVRRLAQDLDALHAARGAAERRSNTVPELL